MSNNGYPIKTPLPIGNKYIGRTSPLHVAQLVLLLLKEIFSDLEEDHPFRYTDDFNTTRINFDTVFNKDSEVYGKKPLIIVSKGSITNNPQMVGDTASKDTQSLGSYRTSLIQSSTEIKVVARESMSVDILGQDIFTILMETRTAIPILTNIHSVTGIQAGIVSKLEEDDVNYYSTVSMSFLMQQLWTWQFDPLLLDSVSLKFNEGTDIYKQVLSTMGNRSI